ncbi:hypothetical protein GCM10009795_040620 [Nocardioides hankookensis]|uniref:Uncharacterized protein n=1 Tax=Nocardioides hankookensis TaxID=443157 RepID=A0ABW1LNZ9_9ACTN
MSAWDAAVFDDDLAADVRDEYRDLLEQRVPDAEATKRVVDAFGAVTDDEDRATFWLALAAAQHIVGRLDDAVKAHALQIIDDGVGMELWESVGGADLARRQKMLGRLRAQLTGPQPAPKRVRRPRQVTTDLVAGDILSLTSDSGAVALFRVLRVEDQRDGQRPIVALLDWQGGAATSETVQGLPIRTNEGVFLYADDDPTPHPPAPAVFAPIEDQGRLGWRDAGFVHVARVAPSPGDDDVEMIHGMHWSTMSWLLAAWLERRDGPR